MKVGRPKLLDREKVIDVALCQYWQHGIDNVGMADIARLSGFDRAGIYKEFGGENGLALEVMENYYETHVAQRLPIFDAIDSPVEQLKLLIDGFIYNNLIKDLSIYGVHDDSLKWPKPPAKSRGCAYYGLMVSDTRVTFAGKTKRKVNQLEASNHEWYQGIIAKAEKEGRLKEGVTVEEAIDFVEDHMLLMQLLCRQASNKDRMLRAKNMLLKSLFAESSLSIQH